MMKPSPAVEAAGLRAYEQVRAFEAVRSRRLPLIYGGIILLLLLCVGIAAATGHWGLIALCLATTVVYAYFAWFHWRLLQARHSTNVQLLGELEARYGDQLPWLEVERHLSAMERLKAELKAEDEAK